MANITRLFLVTGQTGVNHSEVLSKLTKFANHNRPKWVDTNANPLIKVYDIDDYIRQAIGRDVISLRESEDPIAKREALGAGYNLAIKQAVADNPIIAVISLHMLWYRNEDFICPLKFEIVEKADLRPLGIITLIDDLHDIWYRVRNLRPSQSGTAGIRVNFSLQEFAIWRNLEIHLSERLADIVFGSSRGFHYVWAVKHPVDMLWKLMTQPQCLIIYSAFPITSTRNDPKAVHEIDSFRKLIYDRFIVFDPLTIDEYPLAATTLDRFRRSIANALSKTVGGVKRKDIGFNVFSGTCTIGDRHNTYEIRGHHLVTAGKEYRKGGEAIRIEKDVPLPLAGRVTYSSDERWKLYPDDIFQGFESTVGSSNPAIELPIWEVFGAIRQLSRQICTRDFHLIRQGDCIVAYRPNYSMQSEEPSAGVTEELQYAGHLQASGTSVCRALIWCDDDGPLPDSVGTGPFREGRTTVYQTIRNRYTSSEECITFLSNLQEKKKKAFGRVMSPASIEGRIKSWFKEFPYI